MPNILDELVRVKAFQSKGEARMMIKIGKKRTIVIGE